MRYASVCSGVEAASLAWEYLGWKPVWFSEIEPFPSAVLKERFPNVPNLGDMTKIKGDDYNGAVDLLVGGTPCQGFSIAGRRSGLNDERSCLCLSYVRLLKEMRPRWFVWENVPGVFGTNKGGDFKAFIRTIDECGYSCAWRVLDAQYVRVDGFPRAVPQRRRRVFVVGHIGTDWRYPAEVLFEQQGLFGSYPPSRSKKHRDCRAVKDIAEHWCYDNQTYAREPAYTGDICCTLQSHIGTGGNTKPIIVSFALAENTINRSLHTGGNGSGYKQELAYTQNTAEVMGVSIPPHPPRMITPVECERLMGFPDNWTRISWKGKPAEQCPDGHRYRACGNSMCVNVMRWIGMRIDRVDKMESSDEQ